MWLISKLNRIVTRDSDTVAAPHVQGVAAVGIASVVREFNQADAEVIDNSPSVLTGNPSI
jgi:hypothetical protein